MQYVDFSKAVFLINQDCGNMQSKILLSFLSRDISHNSPKSLGNTTPAFYVNIVEDLHLLDYPTTMLKLALEDS